MSLQSIKSWLSHPLVKQLDIDTPETHLIHAKIIADKPFLNKIYIEWYTMIAQKLPKHISGMVCELGSGGGFLKNIVPDVLSSEVHFISSVDLILDGRYLPFRASSLKGIVMVDVLHHIPDVAAFFESASRCLKPGGMVIMIEPWATKWSKFVYSHFHHEPFEPKARKWRFPRGGPLSQANGALPWIVFERDLHMFYKRFKSLKLSFKQPMMPFCYLLSGGVSLKSMVPGCFYPIIRNAETALAPLNSKLAMFALIGLTRQ